MIGFESVRRALDDVAMILGSQKRLLVERAGDVYDVLAGWVDESYDFLTDVMLYRTGHLPEVHSVLRDEVLGRGQLVLGRLRDLADAELECLDEAVSRVVSSLMVSVEY